MDLTKCNGRKYRCKIGGTPVEGKIRVEDDRVYLCQNVRNGADAHDKLGYKYSWEVSASLEENSITGFQLIPIASAEIEAYKDWQEGDKITNGRNAFEVIFRSGEVVILKNEGGRAEGPFTCDEIYDDDYRLVVEPAPEEEIVEVTMAEIASKLGVPVERLHIKKE